MYELAFYIYSNESVEEKTVMEIIESIEFIISKSGMKIQQMNCEENYLEEEEE